MPASTKRQSKPAAPPPRVRPSVKASAPSSKPFLRFYFSASLRSRTLAVLGKVEKAKDSTEHRDALADVIVALTESGMDYYFLRPLKLAKVGFFTEQSASLGMSATTKMLASVIRNIVGRMDQPQLLTISGTIRQLME